jgi:hypothetical protein
MLLFLLCIVDRGVQLTCGLSATIKLALLLKKIFCNKNKTLRALGHESTSKGFAFSGYFEVL